MEKIGFTQGLIILAYEIAAMLAVKGALKDKIQFLPQNDLEKTFVSADQWVNIQRIILF